MCIKTGIKTGIQIGSVSLASPVVLAPMAGVTDLPFRTMVQEWGTGLVFSEMTASRAVLEAMKNQKVRKRLRFFDSTQERLPVCVQLVGYDPEVMAEAARFNEQLGAPLLDINMGCPVKKVIQTEAGAALMKDEKRAGKIIEAVVKAVSIPVTVKMRLGWDNEHRNAPLLAKIAEEAGAAAVTVHGRTRSQFYEGSADWAAIGEVKKAISIPIIGNGDVISVENAKQLLETSQADAVMVGRGAWGRPWFLRQIMDAFAGRPVPYAPSGDNLCQLVKKHAKLALDYYGTEHGLRLIRKHLGWYSKGRKNATTFRENVNVCVSSRSLFSLIDSFFQREG